MVVDSVRPLCVYLNAAGEFPENLLHLVGFLGLLENLKRECFI